MSEPTVPVITLNGATNQTVQRPAEFTDPGATCSDGAVVSTVGAPGPLAPAGSYTVVYTASGAVDVTRTVVITSAAEELPPIDPPPIEPPPIEPPPIEPPPIDPPPVVVPPIVPVLTPEQIAGMQAALVSLRDDRDLFDALSFLIDSGSEIADVLAQLDAARAALAAAQLTQTAADERLAAANAAAGDANRTATDIVAAGEQEAARIVNQAAVLVGMTPEAFTAQIATLRTEKEAAEGALATVTDARDQAVRERDAALVATAASTDALLALKAVVDAEIAKLPPGTVLPDPVPVTPLMRISRQSLAG